MNNPVAAFLVNLPLGSGQPFCYPVNLAFIPELAKQLRKKKNNLIKISAIFEHLGKVSSAGF